MYGVNVYPLLTTIFGATILQLHQVIHRHIYAPSALFSTKVQKFLIILRIYNLVLTGLTLFIYQVSCFSSDIMFLKESDYTL